MVYVLLQSIEIQLYEIEIPSKQERNFIISLAETFSAARVCKDRIVLQNNDQIQIYSYWFSLHA